MSYGTVPGVAVTPTTATDFGEKMASNGCPFGLVETDAFIDGSTLPIQKGLHNRIT